MSNQPQDNLNTGSEKERNEASGAQPENATPAQVEETAQVLSEKDDALKAKQTDAESKANEPEKKTGAENEDPGLVARMTAKGALSGF